MQDLLFLTSGVIVFQSVKYIKSEQFRKDAIGGPSVSTVANGACLVFGLATLVYSLF